MFGLFQAKPPLSPWEKAWAEDRMGWLCEHLGSQGPTEEATLRPDDDRLPTLNTYDDVAKLLQIIAARMRVDTTRIRLQLHSEFVAPEAVGQYAGASDDVVVVVDQSQLKHRQAVIATLARQLAELLLLSKSFGQVRLSDLAWTADLLPVCFGLGIFAANETLRATRPEPEHFAWWGAKQRAYLSARIFGYALALRARLRSENVIAWSHLLREDARAALTEAGKYLTKTGDSVFSAGQLQRGDVPTEVLVDELQTGSASRRISAMWELSNRAEQSTEDERPSSVVDALRNALRYKHPEVRAVAASTLPLYDWSVDALQDLSDALKDACEEVRVSAAGAIGNFVGVDDQMVVENLTAALNDDVRLVVFNAARSLVHFGREAETAIPTLLRRLRKSLNECRDEDTRTLLRAIDSVADNARVLLERYLADDQQYRDFTLELLDS